MAVVPGGDAHAAAVNQIAATAPATRLAAVTPSDSNVDLTDIPRALFVGVAGNIALVGRDDTGNTGTVLAVTAGQLIPVMVRRVLATGTTATGIVALY